MPAPRFQRLPAERRAHILGTARQRIARDGPEAASYNQMIADAGISKTTAYLYFDGKDDLVREVFRDLGVRLSATLGAWKPVHSVRAFWKQLRNASEALQQHLVNHPDDLALVAQLPHAGDLLARFRKRKIIDRGEEELRALLGRDHDPVGEPAHGAATAAE